MCVGACLPRAAEPGRAAPALRGRRSSAGSPRRRCGAATASTWERVRDGLRARSATTSRGSCRDSTTTTSSVRRPGGFVLPHPPRDARTFPTSVGRAHLHCQRRSRRCRSPRDAAPADAAQPRPVQHHDLRARRPLPRNRGRPPGGLRAPRRHRRPRSDRRRAGRPRSPTGPTTTSALRPASGSSRTTRRAVRGRVLPGDEPARPARLHGEGSNSRLEVGYRPPRRATRRRVRWRLVGRCGRQLRPRHGSRDVRGPRRLAEGMAEGGGSSTELRTLALRTVIASFDGGSLPEWARRAGWAKKWADLPVQ